MVVDPKNRATYFALPHGTVGSARGGASKRRYCLVNLRFTSGWPPSKYHVACTTTQIVPRVPRRAVSRYLSTILQREKIRGREGVHWEGGGATRDKKKGNKIFKPGCKNFLKLL